MSPEIEVVRGEPTEEELAALVCALLLVAEPAPTATGGRPEPRWLPQGHRSARSWATPAVPRRPR
ncbi:acyl-CoA carboxylase epsilon subunit [Herbidospora cretacea]|uniref:acyl-CoA carboxylase epsilon subunit n=1 Tax=Herbidospora cretacea TaxID=28444 RepID=UPI0034E2D4AF